MTRPDPSRNYRHRPGQELIDSVELPGWEGQSVWGWDSGTATFFAQLWRNESTSEAPDISVGVGSQTVYPWPSCIALAVVEEVATDPLSAVVALGLADPDPRLRPDHEVTALIDRVRMDGETAYTEGHVRALAWVLGRTDRSPASGLAWRGTHPNAAQVDAEHHMATGTLYRLTGQQQRDVMSGVDAGLWQSLGRNYN